MTLDYYALYLLLAIGTVLSPGPAVIYTIGNTLTRGTRHAIAGFCGVAVGILLVASLASLAVLWFTRWLAAGQQILTLGGALYLLYLGLNSWRQRAVSPVPGPGRIGIAVAASSRGRSSACSTPRRSSSSPACFPSSSTFVTGRWASACCWRSPSAPWCWWCMAVTAWCSTG